MRSLGPSQTVCLTNFDHVGLIFGAVLAPQLSSALRQIAKVAKVQYREKLILNSETGYFSSKTYHRESIGE
jgi:hypothetical protein